ncbi:hypothetical protein V0288_02175 [Pannus brasiliensis CCIBt3594]|uniref:Uncharacterized protein n=1 Tax=Pannus brasiliensis CCIBt3594 TaxID=1427578 RepID=A0AAW9QFP3_9CHRO
MTVYTVEALQEEGIEPEVVKTSLQINCFSGTFRRDRDFPKRFKDEALKIVEEYRKDDIKSFIVETALYITVWKEEPKKPEVLLDSPSIPPDIAIFSERENTETIAPPPAIEPAPTPRRTIVRKYRGQEYTIEI